MDVVFENYVLDTPGSNLVLDLNIENFIRALKLVSDDQNVKISLRNHNGKSNWTNSGDRGNNGKDYEINTNNNIFYRLKISSLKRFDGTVAEAVKDIYVQTALEYVSALIIRNSSLENPEYNDNSQCLVLSDVIFPILKASERLRFLSNLITIEESSSGQLKIFLKDPLVSYSAAWSGLPCASRIQPEEGDHNSSQKQTQLPSQKNDSSFVTIRSKDWWSIIQTCSIAKDVILCVSNEKALELFFFLNSNMSFENGYIYYYLPHISSDI